MVDVAVGEQDLLDRHAGLGRRRLQPVEVAAGIDERAAHRLGAPQQGAILLQRGDRDDRRLERGDGSLIPPLAMRAARRKRWPTS